MVKFRNLLIILHAITDLKIKSDYLLLFDLAL